MNEGLIFKVLLLLSNFMLMLIMLPVLIIATCPRDKKLKNGVADA